MGRPASPSVVRRARADAGRKARRATGLSNFQGLQLFMDVASCLMCSKCSKSWHAPRRRRGSKVRAAGARTEIHTAQSQT